MIEAIKSLKTCFVRRSSDAGGAQIFQKTPLLAEVRSTLHESLLDFLNSSQPRHCSQICFLCTSSTTSQQILGTHFIWCQQHSSPYTRLESDDRQHPSLTVLFCDELWRIQTSLAIPSSWRGFTSTSSPSFVPFLDPRSGFSWGATFSLRNLALAHHS